MAGEIFPQKKFRTKSRLCFVIMPFLSELGDVFDTVENVVEDYCGLTCVRADKLSKSERITTDIWNHINESRFLIADLTYRNPNVFYELGMAHALNKPVILLTQRTEDVPFDIQEFRYMQYDPKDLKSLRKNLPAYIRNCISTVPQDWTQNSYPSNWEGAYLKITELEAPETVPLGQPFEISLRARNNGGAPIQEVTLVTFGGHGPGRPDGGGDATQGYFSVSFPDGVEDLKIIQTNAQSLTGKRGDVWAGERYTLKYPIAEGFKCAENEVWSSGWSYYIRLQGYPKQKGFLWFYVNACCKDKDSGKWMWDPNGPILDVDQRGENVYCGVIDVV
jgi:hypothetical protein